MVKKLNAILKSIFLFSTLSIGAGLYHISPLDIPSWYESEWRKMRDCAGKKDLEIKQPYYFKVKGKNFFCVLGIHCTGFYIWPNLVILSESGSKDREIVGHEMGHVLGLGHGKKLEACVSTN